MVTVLLQALVLFLSDLVWGCSSLNSWRISWGMQTLATCARGLAVWEICWHLLGRYRGIWAFTRRILAGSAGLVVLISSVAARHQREILLPNLERGMELAIAFVIVVLMASVRYYEVKEFRAPGGFATGICMFSCINVVNSTVLERSLYQYTEIWNILGMLSYFTTLLIWIWVVRAPQTERTREEVLMPGAIYKTVIPEINFRLGLLREQLARARRVGETRT